MYRPAVRYHFKLLCQILTFDLLTNLLIFPVSTSCFYRRRSWSRSTSTFSKFDDYNDSDDKIADDYNGYDYNYDYDHGYDYGRDNDHAFHYDDDYDHAHDDDQVVESEKTAKWQYTQHCEELGTEIKKLREEVSL